MRAFLIIPALLGVAIAAQAQVYDSYGRPYDRDDYRREGGDRRGGGIVERSMADLENLRGVWLDHGDRKHVDKALHELSEVRNNFYRGKFAKGDLNEAIEHMARLANSGRLRGRDRDVIYGDVMALRDFRASSGRYGGRYGDEYRDPYYR